MLIQRSYKFSKDWKIKIYIKLMLIMGDGVEWEIYLHIAMLGAYSFV